jgi:hypothetical protein
VTVRVRSGRAPLVSEAVRRFHYVGYSGPDDEYGVAYSFMPGGTRARETSGGLGFVLRDGKASDYLANDMGWRLCSDLMRSVLDPYLPPSNENWIPVSVTDAQVTHTYHVLLAPDASEALSDRTLYAKDGRVIKPVIALDRIGDRHVFTIGGRDLTLIVSTEVREALDASGCTGVSYEKVPAS